MAIEGMYKKDLVLMLTMLLKIMVVATHIAPLIYIVVQVIGGKMLEISFRGSAASTNEALTKLIDLVKVVGNMIFVGVTVILGVKYIWGGVDAKASVKDSLVTLVIAALFFYGYSTISNLFMTGNNLSFINTGSYETTAKGIYSVILYICNFLAVGGLVYIGVRYMMAGAEGKAALKARGVPIVLGIVMVYATITFLNLIVGIL